MENLTDLDADLAEILSSNVGTAAKNAAGVRKDSYRDLVAFGNVTSYSMQQLLHTCPRLFQLQKLEAAMHQESIGDYLEEDNVDFAFGHAVGAGVATFDETRDLEKAIWAAFLAWDIDLFAEKERNPGRPAPNKSFHHAIWALKVYQTFFYEETDLADYKVVRNEATIAVDFENGHFYVGHIDTLLQKEVTGLYKVKENKTTVYSTVQPALYSNSDQALSYALVIDALGAAEYEVLYTVYSTSEMRWMAFEFSKDSLQKAEWLQDQTFTHSNIDLYEDKNFFPKRGSSCIQFGKTCKFYESCDYDSERVYGRKYSDLRRLQSFDELELIEHIDYKFTWSEIINRQKERAGGL